MCVWLCVFLAFACVGLLGICVFICLFVMAFYMLGFFFFFSSRRRHTRLTCDWSSDVCSSDLASPESDVCPHIQLRERAGPRDGGQEPNSHVLHPERDDPEPGLSLEGVDLELGRDERLDRVHGHRPVGEQQVRPAHAPDPRLSAHPGPLTPVRTRAAPATHLAATCYSRVARYVGRGFWSIRPVRPGQCQPASNSQRSCG